MGQNKDAFFLQETFRLAKKGIGWTNPNPMVGAVIVKNGKIIGKGYHRKVGLPHAEIEALKSVKESVEKATLYVSLEPCCHIGKTPPCADAIIKAGITKVVCPVLDPNPKVSGKGVMKLKKAGIDVVTGVLEEKVKKLNEAFFTFHIKKRPFIALKFAASLDGKIATKTGDSKWITNEKARTFLRRLRGQYQAILVGINTVIVDNPHLGTRMKRLKDPLRIILDPRLRIPLTSQVLRDKNVLIITTDQTPQTRFDVLKKKGIEVLQFKGSKIPIKDLLATLRERKIISVFVEGGGKTLGNFVDEKLVDKIYAFYGPLIIGGEKAVSAIGGLGAETLKQTFRLKNIETKQFDDNVLISGYSSLL